MIPHDLADWLRAHGIIPAPVTLPPPPPAPTYAKGWTPAYAGEQPPF